MKSKLDLPFTQQQRGQPHLWFCQAGWRIPDLRIRRNARSFITLWHNGETTCFKKKKNIRPPKSCFPEKWSWYILISTLVHLICFERSTESIRMFRSTWMTECFGSLACFATWNDVETPTLETFATYVAWSKEGARKGARWATVSGGFHCQEMAGAAISCSNTPGTTRTRDCFALAQLRLGELDRTALGCDVVMLWIGKAM